MSPQEAADRVFLALCIWREARGESLAAKRGVAQVVLNRVKHGGWWGNTVTDVLFKRLQFSSLTHKLDKQLTTWPRPADPSWQECLAVAFDALDGTMTNPVDDADSYHDDSIDPGWDGFVTQIGSLKFYRTV